MVCSNPKFGRGIFGKDHGCPLSKTSRKYKPKIYVIVIVHYIRIYGSKPPRTRPRMVYVAINFYVVTISVIYPLE